MTGLELLAGLSFVDERYIAEADMAILGRKIPWMKVLSVAACLCILLVGAFTLENMNHKSATEAAAPAAPAAMEEAAPRQESAVEEAAPECAEIPEGELQHIPYAILQIVKVLDDGSFEAIVKATEQMEVDTQVILVIDPDMVPGGERIDAAYEETITEDMMVEIYDGAFDAGINTLYVAGVCAIEE